MIDIVDRLNSSLSAGYSELRKEAALEIERLRAKIEAMEKQVPICRAEDLRHAEILLPSLGLMPEDKLYALPGAQQCKNCNGMGDRFDPSGEKIPCDLCESHLEEIRSLVAEAAHAIISGSDFWLSISLAAKKIYALPGAHPAPSVPDGWETDLLIVEHAMRMNNWDWNSDTSDDLKRSAYKIISELLAAQEDKS